MDKWVRVWAFFEVFVDFWLWSTTLCRDLLVTWHKLDRELCHIWRDTSRLQVNLIVRIIYAPEIRRLEWVSDTTLKKLDDLVSQLSTAWLHWQNTTLVSFIVQNGAPVSKPIIIIKSTKAYRCQAELQFWWLQWSQEVLIDLLNRRFLLLLWVVQEGLEQGDCVYDRQNIHCKGTEGAQLCLISAPASEVHMNCMAKYILLEKPLTKPCHLCSF